MMGTEIEQACSAVLVTPRIVLTAAHCVGILSAGGGARCDADAKHAATTLSSVVAPKHLAIVTEEVVWDAEGWKTTSGTFVKEVFVPEASSKSLCGNDIAILELEKPVAGITPASVRTSKPVVVGEKVAAVGYGLVGTDEDSSGRRRSLDGAKVQTVGESKHQNNTTRSMATEWILDRGPCEGDSGSPAFDASGELIGIMSRGQQATCTGMIYARLDAGGHAEWLTQTVSEISISAGDSVPAWASIFDNVEPQTNEEESPAAEMSTAPPAGSAPAPEAAGGCQASPSPLYPNRLGLFGLGVAAMLARVRLLRRSPTTA